MVPSVDDPWSGLSPNDVRDLLGDLGVAWWVAGGWAVDLWLGRTTREHHDFDVGCRRADLSALLRALAAWDAYLAHRGVLRRWSAEATESAGSIWLRHPGSRSWDLQVMPEEVSGGTWSFRRDSRIRTPAAALTWTTADGLLVLRPEIQLLYKAKDVRPRDAEDFERALPALTPPARAWLARALRTVHDSHPWLTRLESATHD